MFNSDFIGINEDRFQELIDGLEKYIGEAEEKITGFNEEGDINAAFKGEANNAAREFIKAIKELLQAHVSKIRQLKSDAEKAKAAWVQKSGEIGASVVSEADAVRADAQSIRID